MSTHKFIVSPAALPRVIKRALPLVQAKPVVPVLDSLLFECKDGQLTITSSDLTTTFVSAPLTVEATGDFRICIPAKRLADTLANLPEAPITVTVDLDADAVEIAQAKSRFRLPGTAAIDFPRLPKLTKPTVLALPAAAFSDALRLVAPFASKDALRPAMTAVYVAGKDGQVTVVTTDGNSLVRQVIAAACPDFLLLMPASVVPMLVAALADADEATLTVTGANLSVTAGGDTLVTRLIDEPYPRYESVIPQRQPNKLTVDRDALLMAVKQMTGYTHEKTQQAKLDLSATGVSLSGENLDTSSEAVVAVDGMYEGDEMQIGFNAAFLKQHLLTLPEGMLTITMSTPNRAALLLPEVQPEGRTSLNLLMPLQINSYV